MNTSTIKVAIIIPYFGKWPTYFNLFLKGLEQNKWLTILFFTDCELPKSAPDNTVFKPSSLGEISLLASTKLEAKLNINNAYKLCDLRPCYGKIFEDYLESYDYWGYGDIDLIYGNLEEKILPKLNNGVDFISNRTEIVSGSLSIFKNCDAINYLYKKSDTFIELLHSPKHYGLDETANDHSTWNGGSKLNLPKHCFTYLIANDQAAGLLTGHFEKNCKEDIQNGEMIEFRSGSLLFNGQSLGYYHYVCNKNDEKYYFPNWHAVPDTFYILNTGFFSGKRNASKNWIHRWRLLNGLINQTSNRILKRIKLWL